MSYKWKPSKNQAKEFAQQMQTIDAFCIVNVISKSSSNDSYYFSINGKNYRISNHSIEASNSKALNCFGEQLRDKYHDDERDADTIYIHASKTRLIEIYNNLKNGKELDGRGFVK